MDADLEPRTPRANTIELGCELYDFSVADIDERIELLAAEIERLKAERARKSSHLDAAQAFFKS